MATFEEVNKIAKELAELDVPFMNGIGIAPDGNGGFYIEYRLINNFKYKDISIKFIERDLAVAL